MNPTMIKCPNCKHQFEPTESFTQEIDARLREEYNQKFLSLKKETAELATKEAEKKTVLEITDLKNQVQENSEKLNKARDQELKLLKRQRELEDKTKEAGIELERRVNKERENIWLTATKKISEERQLKDAEKDKQLTDMRHQIDELKRKAEQGSQKTQGDVLELEIEKILKSNFGDDKIIPVPNGKNGADVIQRVYNKQGTPCGTILWELKHRKSWSDKWLQKLKDDQREIKATHAVIVSTVLPPGIELAKFRDGVWIIDFSAIMVVATMLRNSMIAITRTLSTMKVENDKIEQLRNYFITGQAFRHWAEATLESCIAMKADLDSEKRWKKKDWTKREKEIERIVYGMAGLYGDLQAIIGNRLQSIPKLEIPEHRQAA